VIREGHAFDGLDTEVRRWQMWRQTRSELLNARDRVRVCIGATYLIALAKQVDEIPAGPAASIEHSHARYDAAAKKLVEEVDIDLAELHSEVGRHQIGPVLEIHNAARSDG
jgi:hypothetical protein